jgi:hypothetical protein
MKRFLECLWETITFILVTILLALAMFPFGLYCLSSWLFN